MYQIFYLSKDLRVFDIEKIYPRYRILLFLYPRIDERVLSSNLLSFRDPLGSVWWKESPHLGRGTSNVHADDTWQLEVYFRCFVSRCGAPRESDRFQERMTNYRKRFSWSLIHLGVLSATCTWEQLLGALLFSSPPGVSNRIVFISAKLIRVL